MCDRYVTQPLLIVFVSNTLENITNGTDFENQCRDDIYVIDKNYIKQISILTPRFEGGDPHS